jgi:hypothetical protein
VLDVEKASDEKGRKREIKRKEKKREMVRVGRPQVLGRREDHHVCNYSQVSYVPP